MSTAPAQPGPFWTEAGLTFRLALPVIIGQLSAVAMVFVDTVMAGRLSALDLAAVAIGGAVWSTLILFMLGLLLTVPSWVSNYDGAGQRERIAGFIHQVFFQALLVAVLIMVALHQVPTLLYMIGIEAEIIPLAADYLAAISPGALALAGYLTLRFLSDGLGFTKPTMYIGVLGLLLNIPADYVFMYGKLGLPAMGAKGCGYATALVIWCQLGAAIVVVHRHRVFDFLKLFSQWQRPDWLQQRLIAASGLPIAFSLFVESSLFMAATMLMGKLDTVSVAGHQIALNVSAMLFMIPLGMSMAITVRVGNAAGRGDLQAVRFRGKVGMQMVLGIQVISALVLLIFPEQIASLYTDDQVVISIGVSLLLFAAIFQLPDGFQVAAAGSLRGIKDTFWPLIMMIVAYWAIGMPTSYVLGIVHKGRGEGIWIGLIIGLLIASVVLGLRFFALTRPQRFEQMEVDDEP